MSKNSEWGAVAYLSQSIYGKQGNLNYTGANKEIYQNKSTTYITGSSNGTPSQKDYRSEGQCRYDDMTKLGDGKGVCGPGTSTTGTIYGIYDMSGSANEYVMGTLADEDGKPRSGNSISLNSGFNGKLANGTYYTEGEEFPDPKYYDLYNPIDTTNSTTRATTACNEGICYGHALSEISRWYNDNSMFPKIFLIRFA